MRCFLRNALLVAAAITVLSCAQLLDGQGRATRVIDVTLVTRIPSLITSNDDIVVLRRKSHGAVEDPTQTFRDAVASSIEDSKTGMILLVDITSAVGRLNDSGNWLETDVRANVIQTIWSPPGTARDQSILFRDPTGGETTIGKASVKTEDVLFEKGRTYVVFLRAFDERLSPARYPLFVKNERVYNNWDLISKKKSDPLHDRPLKEVVDAIKIAGQPR